MVKSKKMISFLLMCSMVFSFVIPVMAVPQDEFDPYVFVYNSPFNNPDTIVDGLPEYYQKFAGSYSYYSPHRAAADEDADALITCIFNLVNYSKLIQDEAEAPEGPYASVWAYCADAVTYTSAGTTYRRVNLEDGYFCFDDEGRFIGAETARKVRAVIRHTFPYITDISSIQNAVNAYLTETYGEDALQAKDLTGAEVLTASQTAVWHFTNGIDFVSPFPYHSTYDNSGWAESSVKELLYKDTYVDYLEKTGNHTAENIRAVYEYLVNLEGEDSDDVSVTDSTINLVGTMHREGTGDYSLTAYFTLDATIDGDDDLTLTVSLGDHARTYAMGANSQLQPYSNGVYAVTLGGLTAEELTDGSQIVISLSGTQTVNDVCLYEAKPAGELSARKTAQNFVGCFSEGAPVQCVKTYAVGDVEYQTGDLFVNKSVINSSEAEDWESFDFELTVDFSDVSVPAWVTEEYQMDVVASSKALIWEKTASGQYATGFTLQADETIAISGLPIGCTYTLKEVLAEEDRAKLNVTANVLFGSAQVSDTLVSGSIAQINAVNYTNTFVILDTGSIRLSKAVVNSSEAQAWEHFDFKLTLDLSKADVQSFQNLWITDAYLMDLVESSKELIWNPLGDGKYAAEFTLQADEVITVTGVPVGTDYTVEEILSEQERLAVTVDAKVTAGSGEVADTVVSGEVADENAIEYTNTFVIQETGVLEVTKAVVNASAAQEGESFNFRLTLDLSDADVHSFCNPLITDAYLMGLVESSKELTWNVIDGKYVAEFTLYADESIAVEGIPVGTVYVLEEVLSQELQEQYTVSAQVTAGDGEVVDNTVNGLAAQQNAVVFTNTAIGDSTDVEDPIVPDVPDNPGDAEPDDTDPDVPVEGEDSTDQEPGGPIPETGDGISPVFTGLLVILMLLAGAVVVLRKRWSI